MPSPARIYLDHNATSPLAPGVREAIMEALDLPGNPSSPHREGRQALGLIERARQDLADLLDCHSLDLVFCSGGTEANHLGFVGLARAAKGKRVALPPTVHPSLWAAGEGLAREGFALETLRVDSKGRIEREAARELVAAGELGVLGFSWANHELGSIEDIEFLAELVEETETLLFCDAVQALGRLPVSLAKSPLHALALSAHKVGGPKGIGALWLRPGPQLQPLFGGGKQESGRRPGTQATALIAGFAAALETIPGRLADATRLGQLRERLSAGLRDCGAVIHSPEEGLCNTLSARFPGVAGDLLVSSLDLQGLAISTGAACSSGTVAPSPVLLGIGLSEVEALEAIRVSLGPSNTAEDVEALLELLPPIIQRAKRFS